LTDPRDLLERYVRQRMELGETEVVLDGWTEAELKALLSGSAGSVSGVVPAASASPSSDVHVGRAAAPPSPERTRASEARPLERVAVGIAADGPPGTGEMRQAPDAPARGASAEEIVMLPTLDAVRDLALGCPRCRLANSRQHVVFGEGDPAADVMVVGEAPGENEDRTGRPFVGKAGKLLDLLLASVGFEREQVYICNVIKCRPPGNRDPQPDEVEACSPYLLRQVELVKPRAILAVGAFAAKTLLRTETSIGKLRGRAHSYQGVPLIPTYHPAALLRNPAWVRPVWDDLQRLRAALDQA
jgi:DNA polymerase